MTDLVQIYEEATRSRALYPLMFYPPGLSSFTDWRSTVCLWMSLDSFHTILTTKICVVIFPSLC